MLKIKNKQITIIYLIIFALMILASNIANIEAKELEVEEPKVFDKIFEVEISNTPNFEKVKNYLLHDDVKYVAHPEKLAQDVTLSELVASDIDYSSTEVQLVELEVERFTDSKSDKTKIDSVTGVVFLQFIDTTAPKLKIKKDSVTITEGKKISVEDYFVSVKDNSFEEVILDIEDDIDIKKPGEYTAVFTATDSSGNSSSETLNVIVKAKPKPKPQPEPEPVEIKAVSSQTVSSQPIQIPAASTNGSVFTPNRVTRYGYDCAGCRINGDNYSSTASGIKIGADRVRQSNGQWQSGYTYDGYHIIATSSNLPLLSIVKISNHQFSGSGIAAGQPFYAIVGDRGVSGNNIDLFVGSERNLGAISQNGNPNNSNTQVEVVRYGR